MARVLIAYARSPAPLARVSYQGSFSLRDIHAVTINHSRISFHAIIGKIKRMNSHAGERHLLMVSIPAFRPLRPLLTRAYRRAPPRPRGFMRRLLRKKTSLQFQQSQLIS